MRLKEIIIERGENDLWYHGSPDARGLVDRFELRTDSITYIADPDKWEQIQAQMSKVYGVDEKAYFKLIDQAGKLSQSKSITKPVFLSNNRSVATSYARDKPAFDYENSEPRVVTVRTTPGKILTVDGSGARFSGIALTSVYRGLITAGFSKEEIDQVIRHYPHEVRKSNTTMTTDGLSAIAQELGFDTVDVINVMDNYNGIGPKATVRAIFDPDRIRIIQPDMNEDDTFAGATYMHVDTGHVMEPDGTHAGAVWGASGGNEDREEEIWNEISDGDWVAGFKTSEGKFLNREEAANYVGGIEGSSRLDTDDDEFQTRWIEEKTDSPRTIAGAAYLHVPTGHIYGPYGIHSQAYHDPEMLKLLGTENDAPWTSDETMDVFIDLVQDGHLIDGFVTSDNKFLTRKEAAKAVKLDTLKTDPAIADREDDISPPRDWLDSMDVGHGFDVIHEDYQWIDPDNSRNAEAGTMVARASFNVGKNAYLVEIFDLSNHARLYGFGDELFQIGFRPENQSGYEGHVRTGNESNPRAVINGVKQIMIGWVREHKPKAIIVGSPDSQKARIFTMLAQRSQGIMNELGYSSRPFMTMGIVFIKDNITEDKNIIEMFDGTDGDIQWDTDYQSAIADIGDTRLLIYARPEYHNAFSDQYNIKKPKSYWLDFVVRNRGSASSHKIFSTIFDAFVQFINVKKPNELIFAGADEKRSSIYKRLIRRFADDWDVEEQKTPRGLGFILTKKREITEMEHDDDGEHGVALAQTGYWGKAGAGCIIMAYDTKRVLIPLRSAWVEQPHTWGTWGGAIDPGEKPKDAAMREVREEAGYPGKVLAIEHLFRYQDNSFRYDTFLVIVEEEFEAKLNWETERADWFKIGQWPSPLHFGLTAVLKDTNAKNKIGMAGS